MTRHPMTSREKVLSYLENRCGSPVTNEAIAIGTKLKLGTVGPLIARLIDKGLVTRLTVKRKNRAGIEMTTVAIAGYYGNVSWEKVPGTVVRRVKPIPRRVLTLTADTFEAAANKVLTTLDDPDGSAHRDALDLLRVVRDGWRDVKRKSLPPG